MSAPGACAKASFSAEHGAEVLGCFHLRVAEVTPVSPTRPAAVAGSFYPGDPSALAAEVAAYLAEARAGRDAPVPKAIIAPHAGYMYSGAVAASIYARLAPLRGIVRRVVLAGPAHRVYVAGAAVPASHAFASPLGVVPLDLEALDILRSLAFVEVSDQAHALEHSLEVHLPFLQSVLGSFALVPVVVGDATPAEMALLFDSLWGGPETLIVVSSDLSHYLPYESARGRDRDTARAIVALEGRLVSEEACGAAPINGLLEAARRHRMDAEMVDLRNSGDTAGGLDRVVGYGAFAFTEPRHA
jgi:AmmeMemoRadiSam system protein B